MKRPHIKPLKLGDPTIIWHRNRRIHIKAEFFMPKLIVLGTRSKEPYPTTVECANQRHTAYSTNDFDIILSHLKQQGFLQDEYKAEEFFAQ